MVKLPEPEFYGAKENLKMTSRWLFIEYMCGSYNQMMILFSILGTFEILLCSESSRHVSWHSIRKPAEEGFCVLGEGGGELLHHKEWKP